jgi:hypothetical protein
MQQIRLNLVDIVLMINTINTTLQALKTEQR